MDTFPTPHQEEEDIHILIENHIMKDQAETLDKPAQTEKPSDDAARKPRGFRMNGMNFILTFPQCDTKKEIAVERLEQKWKDEMKGYIVCEEQHKDGTPHLHVFLQFHNRKNFKDPHWADFIAGKHGDYKVCKSVSGSVRYVTKDGNYIAKGVDVESFQKKEGKVSNRIADLLDKGKSLSEVKEEEKGFFLLNKRKIEEYAAFIECEKSKKSKQEWVQPSVEGLTDANKQIAEWICSNIRQTRAFKAPQLFITGKPNLGKTSLVEWLKKFLSVYLMPTTEEFYDHYSDDYDLVVLDEFKGQKTIQFLNEFLQGSSMPIRKKGSQGLKNKNLPVIILSNYTLEECYRKANEDGRLDSLRARLTQVEVDSFIDFYHDRSTLI
uniref:Replication-associated protein n=1 Tax=Grus japonensis CRESS-DNA-virus sp. TaxID=2815045 RepID=A0A8A4XCN0_9VIRU|nr:MAG: replication-associated protein [Grus japonensis CRESS-DNA-virus sp.]